MQGDSCPHPNPQGDGVRSLLCRESYTYGNGIRAHPQQADSPKPKRLCKSRGPENPLPGGKGPAMVGANKHGLYNDWRISFEPNASCHNWVTIGCPLR
ncbi:hypothetical protein GW17_00004011 [Ensete ventricosum]|nr:hypothetical protein GW17_00004011 [Ensete ventricosum]